MNINQIEKERKVYQVLHRRFIILRKIHIFGVFPRLLCSLREEIDGIITEKRLRYKIYSEHGYKWLSIRIDGIRQYYLIDDVVENHLNISGKSVWYKIGDAEPLLGAK